MLGRWLEPGEVVHHRNKNKKDNRPENLIVFKTNGDHMAYHQSNFDDGPLLRLEDGSYIFNKEREYDYKKHCGVCGCEIAGSKQLCNECYERVLFVFGSYKEKQENEYRNNVINLLRKYYDADIFDEQIKQQIIDTIDANVRGKAGRALRLLNDALENKYKCGYRIVRRRCKKGELRDRYYWKIVYTSE